MTQKWGANMIKEQLTRDLDFNKLHNAYLIATDDIKAALEEVSTFLSDNFYEQQKNHPDFMLVEKIDSAKNISVEQTRKLQGFLNKTSMLSGRKSAVILGADQMNVNAANSCLKILEDTPSNTHIFLITTNSAMILPTIRSRCAKIRGGGIRHHEERSGVLIQDKAQRALKNGWPLSQVVARHDDGLIVVDKPFRYDIAINDYYIKPFLKTTSIEEHLVYLKEFGSKDRHLWVQFTTNVLNLLVRIAKELAGGDISLSPLEAKFLEQMMPISPSQIAQEYDKLVKLTEDTIVLDLDLRASYLVSIQAISST
jgi:DNA polymerase-3 subunit delta'